MSRLHFAALAAAAVAAGVQQPSASSAVGWFAASDTHLGHDVGPAGGPVTTSYSKNEAAIVEMNALWASPCATRNCTWPAALGGGPVVEPAGVVISGDLIDAGDAPASKVNGCAQWGNFSALYGLDGTDGVLKSAVYEGRGNHDGGNTTAPLPAGCTTVPSRAIVARNLLRAANPSFAIDSISNFSGIHYSWSWPLGSAGCKLHFVQLNLFAGETCGSASNPAGEGPPPGFPCRDSWVWPEHALSFLAADLAQHASSPTTHVVVTMHFGLDGWSRTWFNEDQAADFIATLRPYRTLLIHVGHTHAAGLYSFNGTHDGAWNAGASFLNVMNAPATQKEDGAHNPLPSEFMAAEASLAADAHTGTLRIAQRVGSGWGSVQGSTTFQC